MTRFSSRLGELPGEQGGRPRARPLSQALPGSARSSPELKPPRCSDPLIGNHSEHPTSNAKPAPHQAVFFRFRSAARPCSRGMGLPGPVRTRHPAGRHGSHLQAEVQPELARTRGRPHSAAVNLDIQFTCAGVDWRAVAALLKTAGMASREPAVHQESFQNSAVTVFVYLAGLAFGTALSRDAATGWLRFVGGLLFRLGVRLETEGARPLAGAPRKPLNGTVTWDSPGPRGS